MEIAVNRWNAEFRTALTERGYQNAVHAGNFRNNRRSVGVAIIVFALYAFLDASMLTHPGPAVAYRLTACAASAAIFALLFVKSLRSRHEALSVAIVMTLSSTLFFIVSSEPSIDHTYYVGLIQGGVFVSFLLRLTFPSTVALLLYFLTGHAVAAYGKSPAGEAGLQVIILLTMFLISGFGNYLIQRYRREDYLKATLIERQNERLGELLSAEQNDRRRKVAALNMLLHAVKTPIHQISGFTDLVLSDLAGLQTAGATSDDASIKNARYIKAASEDLRRCVARILAYHQLDEYERSPMTEPVDLRDYIADELEAAPHTTDVSKSLAPVSLSLDRRILESVVRNVIASHAAADALDVRMQAAGSTGAVIEFRSDAPGLSPADFASATRPLTEIDNYLNGDGSSLSMTLRIAARAAEIAGGRLENLSEGGRLGLRVFLPGADPVKAAAVASGARVLNFAA